MKPVVTKPVAHVYFHKKGDQQTYETKLISQFHSLCSGASLEKVLCKSSIEHMHYLNKSNYSGGEGVTF